MALTDFTPLIFIIVAIVGTFAQMMKENRGITTSRRIEILLSWIFLVIVGFGGIWAFIGHTFFADRVAESIGWPVGNPFQQEVGLANLAIGVLGLLSFRMIGSFRVATIIAYSIFMIGAGIGHIWQIITTGNMAVNNAGPILWMDLLVPLVIIIFYLLGQHVHRIEANPSLK
ncbi:hypothetical protein KHC33_13335 [Methanospirillum sp. J.3.6.1-F.2.7.3]|jgi:hypothetical protein|uniref:Uncharacterized protein n=1 Tax=Methanospirillum purgamenti TaxID=2834276 RepID=A0A8E7AWZ7_9EURY|nr:MULTISPECIES: DUF6790 family protein [Methanospirillum]MDX8550565.1 DUF6790 family protein [Methanospirillum hungatei]QVV88300.1 hypothetical protein KHC33_13335 [Methanospirillum sp. J.3.6.1-F.2.7.3]